MTLRGLPRPGESGPRTFGEPYETPDGTTVITVTSPPGVFAIREGQARWEPAVDATRIALLAVGIGLVSATLAGLAMVRRPPWPDVRLRR
jgi:hypothetical protein